MFSFDIDYGLNHIFFRDKTFCFFKIESWNCQHLFEKEFCETSQNFNKHRQPIKKMKITMNELYELKLCGVSQNSIFSFLSWKNKKVLFLCRIFFMPYCLNMPREIQKDWWWTPHHITIASKRTINKKRTILNFENWHSVAIAHHI